MEITTFFATVTPQDLTLTANRRLGAFLQKSYDSLQVEKGLSAWQSLQIIPLQSWVEQVWNNFSQDPRICLNNFQELLIWEKCIQRSPASELLMNSFNTAKLAEESWKLLHQWNLSIDDIAYSHAPDVQAFVGWARSFQEICRMDSLISRHELTKLLIEDIRQHSDRYILPRNIFFIGFDDISPMINLLQQELQNLSHVETLQFKNSEPASAQRLIFSNKHEEIQEMARWSYQKIVSEPNKVVGCIIPNLAENRSQVVTVFKDIFYAENMQQHFTKFPFNISAAECLNNFPIIQAALTILSLNYQEISFDALSSLLRTPFIKGSQSEFEARALLDVKLRSYNEKKINIVLLLESNLLLPACKIFRDALIKFFQCHSNVEYHVDEWSSVFAEQLKVMGWPGERSLTSTEFQLLERFKQLLVEFSMLKLVVAKISYTTALMLLQRLATMTLFQPKTDDMPIQVLGVLEASGISFDFLWVAGMDSENWPPSPTPNPFIPIEIQRKLSMPHATSERELQFSKGVTERLLLNAGEVLFSHADYDGDRHIGVSPLIAHHPILPLPANNYTSIEQQLFALREIEVFVDDYGPPVSNELVIGGSGLFKAQAACPFQAFAKYRLRAEPLDDIQIGFAFHERGLLVHDVLANFWQQVKNHDTLCVLSEEELQRLVVRIIDSSVHAFKRQKLLFRQQSLFNLEKKRLLNLIMTWLQIEKSRQSFEVIGCEEKHSANIAGLSLHLQIDRIDRLADGSHLIIDYKTGRPSVYDWFSERPNDPQLPLYAIVTNMALSGILFAQIRTGELAFKGVIAENGLVPNALTLDKLKDNEHLNIPSLIASWQIILERLADDFAKGKALVAPKEYSTCQYCALHELCRINPLR